MKTQTQPQTTKTCPTCGSPNIGILKGVSPLAPTATGGAKPGGFQVLPNKQCFACGTVWKPPCPRWAAIMTIVTSVVLLVFFVGAEYCAFLFFKDHNLADSLVGGVLLVFGLAWLLIGWVALRNGIRFLRGKGGGLEIVHLGAQNQPVSK